MRLCSLSPLLPTTKIRHENLPVFAGIPFWEFKKIGSWIQKSRFGLRPQTSGFGRCSGFQIRPRFHACNSVWEMTAKSVRSYFLWSLDFILNFLFAHRTRRSFTDLDWCISISTLSNGESVLWNFSLVLLLFKSCEISPIWEWFSKKHEGNFPKMWWEKYQFSASRC